MPLSRELLGLIVCPKCKEKLVYIENEAKLNCESCRLIYKIEDDIPILLIDEAEKY
jgi:uncharacterized protein